MPRSRRERAAISTPQHVFTSFAYSAPLRLVEHRGDLHILAPKHDWSGRTVRPLDDPELGARFLNLSGDADELVAFFQPLGLPIQRTTRSSADVSALRAFGIEPNAPVRAVLDFQRKLRVFASTSAALQDDPRHAHDFVSAPTRRKSAWTFSADGYEMVAAEPVIYEWLASQPEAQRRFLACHYFLDKLLSDLLTDRFDLRPTLLITGGFDVRHPIIYQPRDLLGAILFQFTEAVRGGRRLGRCAYCSRAFTALSAKGKTCSDRCRQAHHRAQRAAQHAGAPEWVEAVANR